MSNRTTSEDCRSTNPFTDDELNELFADLHGRRLALCVSGGADSMALMHLVSDWLGAHPERSDCLVLSVDHQLRDGSDAEATFVAAQAHSLGFQHDTLNWTGPKPTTAIQAHAREARRRLLANRALAEDRVLVMAHHLEDQAETFLMRLARGSGHQGLAAMQAVSQIRIDADPTSPRKNCTVVRPLLNISKVRLRSVLQSRGKPWIDDPSNQDERYERVRVRQALDLLKPLGLSAPAITRSARRIAEANRALKLYRSRAAAAFDLQWRGGLYGSLSLTNLSEHDDQAAGQVLLAALLAAFGGSAPRATLAQIETLWDEVATGVTGSAGATDTADTTEAGFRSAQQISTTLGGCLVWTRTTGGQTLLCVAREARRVTITPFQLAPSEARYVDGGRYRVGLSKDCPQPVELAELGEQRAVLQRREFKARTGEALPLAVFQTQPVLSWTGEGQQQPEIYAPTLSQPPRSTDKSEAATNQKDIILHVSVEFASS